MACLGLACLGSTRLGVDFHTSNNNIGGWKSRYAPPKAGRCCWRSCNRPSLAESSQDTPSQAKTSQVRKDEPRQDKTRQDETRQGQTRQDWTQQGKTRQDTPKQDTARQDRARQYTTRQDKARQYEPRHDTSRQGKTRQQQTSQDKTRLIMMWLPVRHSPPHLECRCSPHATPWPRKGGLFVGFAGLDLAMV